MRVEKKEIITWPGYANSVGTWNKKKKAVWFEKMVFMYFYKKCLARQKLKNHLDLRGKCTVEVQWLQLHWLKSIPSYIKELTVLYFFWYHESPDFEPWFWHLVLPMCIASGARVIWATLRFKPWIFLDSNCILH